MAKGKGRGGYGRKRAGKGKYKGKKQTGGLVSMSRKAATRPDRMTLRMNYVDNIVLSGGVASGTARAFRVNSLYDPDTSTLAGHQPLGYDQWSVFYQKYRVYKADVTVRLANVDANSADAVQCALFAYNANGAGKVIDDSIFEQPHTRKAILGGRGGMDRATLRMSVNLPKILGMAPVVYKSVSTTSSLFGTNPLEAINASVICRALDGQSSPLISCEVTIVYHAELFDPIVQTISYPAGKDPEDTTLDTGSNIVVGA